MGLSCKPVGKLRGVFYKIEQEEIKKKVEENRGKTKPKNEKEPRAE